MDINNKIQLSREEILIIKTLLNNYTVEKNPIIGSAYHTPIKTILTTKTKQADLFQSLREKMNRIDTEKCQPFLWN